MPVTKFRTFEDARRALAREAPADPTALATRVADLWALAAALAPPLDFRGVRKYRSIEEADEDRRRVTIGRRT
ncbi:MAG TPA: hypothetical protein VMM93_07115 [Vicinamibacterales bacterium]|nr:hypothetical protein [Vicinamibacterales bacterium]